VTEWVEVQFIGAGDVLAQWNCETDSVSFNWRKIEDVALTKEHPLRGLAKIILAARDMGRNDPLPGFVE
jgi:hypothetical protein